MKRTLLILFFIAPFAITQGQDGQFVLGLIVNGASYQETIYYPENFGATGDGTTNDAAAFQAMIDAAPAGSLVKLSSKTYLINTQVNINKPLTFEGNGCADWTGNLAKTLIKTTSPTIHVFYVSSNNVQFERIAWKNMSISAPTAGSGVYFAANSYSLKIDKCSFWGFWNNIDIRASGLWGISNSYTAAYRNDGIRIENVDNPDFGDSFVTGCWIVSSDRTVAFQGNAGIEQLSSGGLKISNCKFVANHNSGKNPYAFRGNYTSTPGTVDLLINGNSFEGYSQHAIYITRTGAFFHGIEIVGNQFAAPEIGTVDININDISNLVITGNVMQGNGSKAAINLGNVTRATISGNSFWQYGATKVSQTSCTDIVIQ